MAGTPQGDGDDPRVAQVVERVEARPSVEAEHEEVRSRAQDAVDDLSDQPVQTFTPLLAENRVVDELGAAAREEPGGSAG